MKATRRGADRLFHRVTIVTWTATILTAIGLGADLVFRTDLGPLRRASLIAALGVWGFMFWLRLRLRSVKGELDDGYATLFESHPQPVLLADIDTLEIVSVNNAARVKYGYSDEEFADLSVFDLHRPEDHDYVRSAWVEIGATGRKARNVGTHIAKDGTAFAAEVLTSTLELDARCVRMVVVTDVTDRDAALADTRESGARYRQIVETAKEGIVIVDADMAISVVNERAANMLGYSADELVGHRISEFYGAGGAEFARAAAVQQAEGRLTGERETTLRRRDGTIVSVLLNESPLLDRKGRYAGQLGMITDLTERKGFEDELAFQAIHDPLTGLPNRLLLVDRLQVALSRAKRGPPDVAVVSLDVDGFKDVNTAHGHAGGDQLLALIAGRLSRTVRQRDTVARFGGDEFVIVSDGSGLFVERLAERLREALAAPYSVGGADVTITVSMGIAVGQFGDRPATLLHSADMALLQAKANGRDRTEFFTEALRATSKQRLAIVSDLRRAVERNEFSLRFQPVVSLIDQSIIGAEALIRWEHPERGTLDPGEFISVAEETGLIHPIGRWVIEETCRRFAAWQRLAPDLSMSLNISARQFTAGDLDDIVRAAITASGVDPSRLELEITEAVLMDDVDLARGTLAAVRKAGVKISVDDFGTGYSSLSRLKSFPVDVLKIDQTFVAGLPDDTYDTALVRAVVAIAASLNLSVIAEGVETGAQAKALLGLGCRKAQGYLFYRPLTSDDFAAELIASLPARAPNERIPPRTHIVV
jgi:diguanylate cyclase (GGDEF)-like protein/PAS domain S-box-containing protein